MQATPPGFQVTTTMSAVASEKEDVEVDVKQPHGFATPALEDEESSRRTQWTTTRVELWAFYVYYIVSCFYRSLIPPLTSFL